MKPGSLCPQGVNPDFYQRLKRLCRLMTFVRKQRDVIRRRYAQNVKHTGNPA